jgi:hypothetical protein
LTTPEFPEGGQREHEDRGIDEKAEFLIEEEPGQAFGQDIQAELAAFAVDPPRVEESPQLEVVPAHNEGRSDQNRRGRERSTNELGPAKPPARTRATDAS